MTAINLEINGRTVKADVEPRTSLAEFLRNHEFLTGTHIACEHGVCGSCTVMINDAPARSCIAFAVALDGSRVRTVEGFEADPVMEKLRDAFRREHGVQCGYCTPGMLITSRDIVTRLAAADEKRIRTELAGNLCRCTGYVGIVNAIQRVMRELPAELRLGTLPPKPAPRPGATPFRAFEALTEAGQATPAAAAVAVADSSSGKGGLRIDDRFSVAAPRQKVWEIFADFSRMARCMPGAELTSSDGRNLTGNVRITFGPIKASFGGTATVERNDANFEGILRGGGNDAKGGSRAKGQVTYRLIEEQGGTSTRVELSLEFQLQGPLAQFGRTGLVKDFAGRLIGQFAQNLSADLVGRSPQAHADATSIKASAMFWSMLWGWLRGRPRH